MQAPDDPEHDAVWFVVRRSEILVIDTPDGPRLPSGRRAAPIAGRTSHVLGTLRGSVAWGIDAEDEDAPDGHRWMPLRGLFGQIDEVDWVVAGRAEQIVAWDRTHRFCGRCGTPTESHQAERSRVCPRCKLLAYPRLSPATITLVERGDEVLLAHGRQFPGRFYSTIAGFVEPGENLEQCVIREVEEETGITVTDVKYFGSQPWPFPNSLMLGFTAKYASGDISIQESEIVDAGWFRPDNLPPCPRGGMSIAGWLIEDWLRRSGAL
ncbi:MAG: NAD(+) diphosphatase [Dehalococcoidia bacterium]